MVRGLEEEEAGSAGALLLTDGEEEATKAPFPTTAGEEEGDFEVLEMLKKVNVRNFSTKCQSTG